MAQNSVAPIFNTSIQSFHASEANSTPFTKPMPPPRMKDPNGSKMSKGFQETQNFEVLQHSKVPEPPKVPERRKTHGKTKAPARPKNSECQESIV